MLPLRERIFPDVDCDIESNPIWISTIARKKNRQDGKYYLIEIRRELYVQDEAIRPLLIHRMINEFNYMVFMFLMFSPVDPEAVDINGMRIFYLDPDQTDDLIRAFKTTDEEQTV